MKHAIAIAIPLLFTGCTNDAATKRTLDDAGYTDIQITGGRLPECGFDVFGYSTGFSARNINGKLVVGAVCCGLLAKGCTIRH